METLKAAITVVAILIYGLSLTAQDRALTVAEDIGFSYFGDPWTGKVEAITYAPNGRYFIVYTERGRLDLNRTEGTVRVYSSEDVRHFLKSENQGDLPATWVLKEAPFAVGPTIQQIRWLPDSSGFSFLEKDAQGNNALVLADLQSRTTQRLSEDGQHVTGFDVMSRREAVLCVQNPAILKYAAQRLSGAADVGTGVSFYDLVFPLEPVLIRQGLNDQCELWAIIDGKRSQVKNNSTGKPVYLYRKGASALALSPDGSSVLTALPLPDVPKAWESLYRPSRPNWPIPLKAGPQNLDSFGSGWGLIEEYALLSPVSGGATWRTGAPIAAGHGWAGLPGGAFSPDGRYLALFSSYLPPAGYGKSDPPYPACVAIVDLVTQKTLCLQHLRGSPTEPGLPLILSVRFVATGSGTRIVIEHRLPNSNTDKGSITYALNPDNSWKVVGQTDHLMSEGVGFDLRVHQGLNTRPVLLVSDPETHKTKLLLDPNPQLSNIELGEVSVFTWKDKNGQESTAGLYKPLHFTIGKRYPLVIQTHGFAENQFSLGGAYPTGFAAQELASAGIMVLQMNDCREEGTPEEGPCNVAHYESAANRLAAQGLIDPARLGIIGFSRSCYYVMEALTTSSLKFKAASITDGVNYGYMQFLIQVDTLDSSIPRESTMMMGQPFGAGLQDWLGRSPEFNLNKVSAALQVVASGRPNIAFMWEPYAMLRYLKKPVELTVLHTYEHVLTNPAVRLVSQGGTVDWFRFWLQDYEDPDPSKAEQYKRWRELRTLSDQNSGAAHAVVH